MEKTHVLSLIKNNKKIASHFIEDLFTRPYEVNNRDNTVMDFPFFVVDIDQPDDMSCNSPKESDNFKNTVP